MQTFHDVMHKIYIATSFEVESLIMCKADLFRSRKSFSAHIYNT